MITKIYPINDNILISPETSEEKVINGIIIPELGNQQPQQGTIVSLGSGEEISKSGLKENDVVIYQKFAGSKFVIDNKTFLIMGLEDIVARLEQI